MLLDGCYIYKDFTVDVVNELLTGHRKYIRDSEEYKQTLLLYDEYVKNISNYLKQFEFECSIDETVYLDKLIDSGTVSSEKKFNYKVDKYDSLCLPELVGARIASGTGVCRHISGLSRDILSKREIDAVLLSVRPHYGQHPEILKYLHLNIPNHNVVGIVDKDGKYIFDSTMHYWAISSEEHYQSKKFINTISQIIDTEHPKFYNIYHGRLFNILRDNQEQELFNFNQTSWKNITSEELNHRKNAMLKLFEETEYERQKFYAENKDLMKELAIMDSILCPYSDEEKPRWVLHKS